MVNTAATEPVVTVNETGCDDTSPADAVTVADPSATPSTRPCAFTVATDVADDVYVIVTGTWSPSTPRAIAVNCTGSPTAIVCLGAVRTTDRTSGDDGSESPQADRTETAAVRTAVRTAVRSAVVMMPRENLVGRRRSRAQGVGCEPALYAGPPLPATSR